MTTPLDETARALVVATRALAANSNLWYGDLCLLVRDFAHDAQVVECWIGSTSDPGADITAAERALAALARPTATTAWRDTVTALGSALAACSPRGPLRATIRWEATDAERAHEVLHSHLASTWQMGRGDAAAKTLIDVLAQSGHHFWLGDFRRYELPTTTILAAPPTIERVVLFDYVGDGP